MFPILLVESKTNPRVLSIASWIAVRRRSCDSNNAVIRHATEFSSINLQKIAAEAAPTEHRAELEIPDRG